MPDYKTPGARAFGSEIENIEYETGKYAIAVVNKAAGSTLPAGENHIGTVGGRTVIVSDSFARPSDTTAYAANDAVAAVTSDTGTTVLRSLANVARINGGSGYLTKFRLWTNKTGITVQFRVHLYTVSAPPSAVAGDNSLMALKWANRLVRIGAVDLPAMATGATGSDVSTAQELDKQVAFVCAAGDRNIYYRLETLGAFTPDNGQQFFIEIAAEIN